MGFGRKDTKLIQMMDDHKSDMGLHPTKQDESRVGYSDILGNVMGDIFKPTQLKDTMKFIQNRRQVLQSGHINAIPLDLGSFSREYLYGFEQGDYVMLAADSNVGKSKLSKFLFITNPAAQQEKLKKQNKTFNFKTVYFGMEESEEEFVLSIISNRLFRKYRDFISQNQLKSKKTILSHDVIDKINEDEEYYDKLFSNVFFVEMVTKPQMIIRMIRQLAVRTGSYYKEGKKLRAPRNDRSWKNFYYDEYRRKDPNTFVHVVFDHIKLIDSIEGMSERETLEKFTFDPLRLHLSKFYKMTPVIVQMLMGTTGNRENIRANDILPSKAKLGDAKSTYNNVLIALGLTDPTKYELKSYAGYNSFDFEGRLRILNIFKNRGDAVNILTPLVMYGEVDMFYKLPSAQEVEKQTLKNNKNMMEQIRRSVLKREYLFNAS